MCHTLKKNGSLVEKRSSHLEKWVTYRKWLTLRKRIILGKMVLTGKTGSHLKKLVTLAKRQVTPAKMGHTLKNESHLDK